MATDVTQLRRPRCRIRRRRAEPALSEVDPPEGVQDLSAHGVAVEVNEVQGGLHGFDHIAPEAAISRTTVARRVHFLRRIVAGSEATAIAASQG